MARRKKRKKWPYFLSVLIVIGLLGGLGAAAKKQLPGFFASAGDVVETVKVQVKKAQSERAKAKLEGAVPFQPIDIKEDDVSAGYYYQQLNKEEKNLYKELYQGIRDCVQTIYVHSADMEALKKVSLFIFNDRPEIFWCNGEMQVVSYEAHSEVQPVYAYSGEEKAQRQAQIEEAAAQCFAGITTNMSEYDKIKYVFEYIVNTVDYNLEAPDNQNIYSALVSKSSVCAGYSRSAQYLLQRMGVECIYVTGNIPQQGAHAWNIVKCGGQYYQMDATFGDPVFLAEGGVSQQPAKSINYDYLCCSDGEILKNHTMDTNVVYPPCTSMDLNYYKLNGMYYDTFQPEQLLQEMNRTIYNRESSFTCKFASDTLYQQAHDVVLNDLVQRAAQNLLDYYGLDTVQYTYTDDSEMNKIIIYWNYQ